MKKSVKVLMVFTLILAVIIGIAIVSYKASGRLPKAVNIPTENQPTTGNANAKLHFVVFEDLKCHNCMRYNVEMYPTIKKEFIDTGKAKYTVINVAFIQGSLPAANAARCVYMQNKNAFFQYVETIYLNQPPETQNWATLPVLVNFANNIPNINKKKLSQCIYKSPYTDLIQNNFKIAKQVMGGVVATPTIFINGYIVKPLTLRRIRQIAKAAQ